MAAIGHPIVGDGKYGGQEAFLSGSISRKMHLHARRLIIDHPDGTPLDVTAPLPEHFAASLEQLGFELAEGDAITEAAVQPAPEFTRSDEKAVAKQHAKQYRKERRGERRGRAENGRSRNDANRPVVKKAGPNKGKVVGASGKGPGAKPAGAKRPGASRPAGGRPTGSGGPSRSPQR